MADTSRSGIVDAPSADLAQSGTGEVFKAVMHGLVLTTCAPVFAYNLWALTRRRGWHLALNAVIFGAVVLVETFGNIPRHIRNAGGD